MNSIFSFISSLKFMYIMLVIIVVLIVNIFLNKYKVNNTYKYLINGIVLVILGSIINYLKDIIDGIFSLKYLSVKLYLINLIIVNIIMINTINKKYSYIYRIVNYILFIITSIIFITNIVLIIVSNVSIFNNIYSIKLINSSIIILISYLVLISSIYLYKYFTKNKKVLYLEEKTYLTKEELFNLKDKENFSINGINISIIFDDSIEDNIYNNYLILAKDVNDVMLNGFTLEENKILKSISLKTESTNIMDIDLEDLDILEKLTPNEYEYLLELRNKEEE